MKNLEKNIGIYCGAGIFFALLGLVFSMFLAGFFTIFLSDKITLLEALLLAIKIVFLLPKIFPIPVFICFIPFFGIGVLAEFIQRRYQFGSYVCLTVLASLLIVILYLLVFFGLLRLAHQSFFASFLVIGICATFLTSLFWWRLRNIFNKE